MRKTSFFVLLLLGGRVWAGHGVIQTADGKTLEGEIRLECGGAVISATNQPPGRGGLANLAFLRFQVSASELIPTPTGRPASSGTTNVSARGLPAGIQF